MNPDKDLAQFHTMVVTEIQPTDIFNFESLYDKNIRTKMGSSNVYIEYAHGMGNKVNDFNECLDIINKRFYDLGDTTFTIRKGFQKESGNIVVISWKNPYSKRLETLCAHGVAHQN